MKVVRYLGEHGKCTTAVIAELLNVKDRQARGILGNMVKKDILKKSGNARNTVYLPGGLFSDEE